MIDGNYYVEFYILFLVSLKDRPSFQGEDGEKCVVYNTVGPRVCMGDHKVNRFK